MPKASKTIRALRKGYFRGRRALRKWFVEPMIRRSFRQCGDRVRIPRGCLFSGVENVSVGHDVFFGVNTRVLTTQAQLILGNYIMFGPGVTIITGDHRTDVLGKYMCAITDGDKRPEDDADVIIEDDVWVGANATILKGVTIGRGSVVAAGAVVTKSFPPYSIIGGVPATLLKSRFTPEEIEIHEKQLAGERHG